MVAKAEATLGPVDIVVSNAGTFYYTLMKNLHEDEWDQMIDVNCKVSSTSLKMYNYIYL